MREYSVPAAAAIAPTANMTDHLVDALADDPDRVQFRRRADGGWRPVTLREFMDQARGAAKGLIASGVQPGDRVGLMSRTRYEWTVFDIAILLAGAVTVPIYETSSAEQVRWILGDSGAVAVVVETPEHASLVSAVRPDLPTLRQVWTVEDLEQLATAGQAVDDETLEARRRSADTSTVSSIVYTSGTTGRPKGCTITHGNMLAVATGMVSGPFGDELRYGTSTLLFLPLAHVMGRDIQFGSTWQGAPMGHTYDLAGLVDDLQVFRPDYLLSVPRVFEKVYNMASAKAAEEGRERIFDSAAATAIGYSQALDRGRPGLLLRLRHAVFDLLVYRRLRDRLGGQVSWALSAGAPLGTRLAHFFRGAGITVYEVYGMTENFGPATLSHRGAMRVGTVGRPIPGSTIRVADDGEILIKGPHVMAGYWNNPAATAETIDPDGWLRTGDIGQLDDDGYLSITGRKKDLIVTSGGKNVAPAVLEDRARASRLVSQIMVVGDNRPFVAALVTLDREFLPTWLELRHRPNDTPAEKLADDPDVRAEIQQSIDRANTAVSRAESIRAFRILPDDFTVEGGQLTPSMKLKRDVVSKEHAADIEALYSQI
ncbi:MAG TPA: AMP-dependent synthetase/ligase [Actinomycetes bacterium]